MEARADVYQYFDGGIVNFTLPVIVAIVLGGVIAAVFAFLIGLPVLRLKSDYLAIATLGFAEIIRALVQYDGLGPAHERLQPAEDISDVRVDSRFKDPYRFGASRTAL